MYTATFLMRDGRVANLTDHLARLRDGGDLPPAKISEVRDQLRAAGPGIHRPVIQVSGSTVAVDIPPAVVLPDEAVVDAEPVFDERRSPTANGPDLGWQTRRLAQVIKSGADEGLLVDGEGRVISGIRSALLFLDGGSAHVSAHPRSTYSVTLEATLAMLVESGVEIVEHPEGLTIPRLRTSETWLLNSRTGVRQVTGWMEYASVLPPRLVGRPREGAPTHREINERMWAAAEQV